MEGILAIGLGYVAILLPAIIFFIALSTRQKSLEKRLDALVQMTRITGEAVGVEEITDSLVRGSPRGRGLWWGIVLTTTAVGIGIAGMLIEEKNILSFAIAVASLGIGLSLAQIWFGRVMENPSNAAS